MTDLPDGWTSPTVGSLCEKVDKIDPADLGRSEFLYVDIGSITPGQLWDSEASVIAVGDAPTRARQLLEAGDTLFSTVRPYLLKIVGVSDDLHGEIASTGFCVLRPRESVLVPRLLTYYCVSDHALNQILPLQRGVSYPAVRDKEVAATLMPLPPREEQDEIVRILDIQLARLDTVLEAVKAVRDRADQLRRSLLHAAFTGQLIDSEPKRGAADGPGLSRSESDGLVDLRTEPFSAVFDVITRGVTKVKRSTYKEFGPLPVVDQGEQKIGGYTDQENSFVGELPVILFGDHTRNVKLVDFEFAVGADGVKVLRTKTGVHPVYAYYHLLATEIRSKGYARHFSQLREKCFWVPSAPAQDEIVGILDSQLVRIEKALGLADWVEAECGRLRRSLLQAAFTGELTRKWRKANG